MIALPAYTGTIHLATVRSLLTDLLLLHNRGDEYIIFDECGNALLADARALIVAKFLESTCDSLVFIDHDVCWETGALLKLIDAPVDMVAGIYPQRRDPINFCIKYCDKPNLILDEQNGLLEVEGVPAGFMKLSRVQLEKMADVYRDTEFFCEPAKDHKAWALFSDYRIGIYKLGEDYAFCKRWRDTGGKVWVNTELKLGHIGNKTFIGHLGDSLRSRA